MFVGGYQIIADSNLISGLDFFSSLEPHHTTGVKDVSVTLAYDSGVGILAPADIIAPRAPLLHTRIPTTHIISIVSTTEVRLLI